MLYQPNPDKPMHQMTLPTIDGKGVTVSGSNNRWQMMIVYRGLHWPNLQNLHSENRGFKRQI